MAAARRVPPPLGAGRLYLLHIAFAALGAMLLLGVTALIHAGQSFAAPRDRHRHWTAD